MNWFAILVGSSRIIEGLSQDSSFVGVKTQALPLSNSELTIFQISVELLLFWNAFLKYSVLIFRRHIDTLFLKFIYFFRSLVFNGDLRVCLYNRSFCIILVCNSFVIQGLKWVPCYFFLIVLFLVQLVIYCFDVDKKLL